MAACIAADDGLVDVDEPIAGYLTGTGLALGDGVDRVTLRHLLTMTSGIDMPWSATELTDWPDLAAEFLRRPSRGRVFQYANASTYTAMRVLETRVGDVGAFVSERLFVGQWVVVLGLAVLPWALQSALRVVRGRPSPYAVPLTLSLGSVGGVNSLLLVSGAVMAVLVTGAVMERSGRIARTALLALVVTAGGAAAWAGGLRPADADADR